MSCNNVCSQVEIVLKNEGQWCISRLSPALFRKKRFDPNSVVFIFAQGDKVRSCETCRNHFERIFQVPEVWWSTWCRRANGYFGSEENVDNDGELEAHSNLSPPYVPTSTNRSTYTWFRFIIKRFLPNDVLEDEKDYVWYKFNIFTNWVARTKTTHVLVFDPRLEVKDLIGGSLHTPDSTSRDRYTKKPTIDLVEIHEGESLQGRHNEHSGLGEKPSPPSITSAKIAKMSRGLKPKRLLDRITDQSLTNPYAIHALFMEDVVYQLEESVWGIRDRLRIVELQRTSKEDPNPNYESVHDVARHAIHVSETIDAAVSTIISMKGEHDHFRKAQDLTDKKETIEENRIRRRLNFSESMLRNLRFRSSSNMTRLQNEIQLAFNIVSQQIGRSAKADSNAMLAIALLTMLFLPPTFMSGIFSMSFFNFDSQNNSWVWSSKIWLYWAFTLPITLLSVLLFSGFYVINHPAQAGSLTPAELKKIKLKKLLLLQWRIGDNRSHRNPA